MQAAMVIKNAFTYEKQWRNKLLHVVYKMYGRRIPSFKFSTKAWYHVMCDCTSSNYVTLTWITINIIIIPSYQDICVTVFNTTIRSSKITPRQFCLLFIDVSVTCFNYTILYVLISIYYIYDISIYHADNIPQLILWLRCRPEYHICMYLFFTLNGGILRLFWNW